MGFAPLSFGNMEQAHGRHLKHRLLPQPVLQMSSVRLFHVSKGKRRKAHALRPLKIFQFTSCADR